MGKATILTSLVILTALVGYLGPLPTPERTQGPFPTLDATTLAEVPTATALIPAILVITISPIPPDIPKYNRTQWRQWTDQDGNCQNARQETLAAESVAPVTFETPAECRATSGQWRDPYTGRREGVPNAVDIDHLVPLQNAHNSGGWAWPSEKKDEYANYLGDPNHLIAVTTGANRSKGERGPEDWRPRDERLSRSITATFNSHSPTDDDVKQAKQDGDRHEPDADQNPEQDSTKKVGQRIQSTLASKNSP